MTLDCIKVWRFDDAPAQLKVGYRGTAHPQWLALVPRSIMGPDLEKAIRSHSDIECLSTYMTDDGDVIHIGSSRVNVLMEAVTCVTRCED